MKKYFTLFVIGLMAICSLGSCSDEAFDTDSVNKQTILIFFPWTGGESNNEGLTSYLTANVNSIEKAIVDKKGLNNTRVLLFFSSDNEQNTLFDLQYDESTKTVNRVVVKDDYNGGANYNSAEGFAELLNEVKEIAPALNYALIIGAHGCGWTYSDDWQNYPYYSRRVTLPTSADTVTTTAAAATSAYSTTGYSTTGFSGIQYGPDPNNPLTRFFGSVSLKSHAMDVTTLAEGIKLSGIKMQYILFDACYMGNVETAYALKDATNYMIASGSEVLAEGLPYSTIWNYLNSDTPNYSSIVSGTIDYYKTAQVPYCNLAAIDCRQLDKLASVMKEINSQYSLSDTTPLDSIQYYDGFQPNLFYDMQAYVDSLHPSGYLLDQFNSQLKLTVKAAQSTDSVYTGLYTFKGSYIPIKTYCGLSISDPSKHNVALRGREKTGWWKATH